MFISIGKKLVELRCCVQAKFKVGGGGDKPYKEFFGTNFCFIMKDLNAKYYLEMVLNLKFIALFLF
jgi:hypothetical protein